MNYFFPIVKSEAKTKEIIQTIEEVIDTKFTSEKERLATKEDILELKIEMKEQKSLCNLTNVMFYLS